MVVLYAKLFCLQNDYIMHKIWETHTPMKMEVLGFSAVKYNASDANVLKVRISAFSQLIQVFTFPN